MLKPGRYVAECGGDIFHAYRYVLHVKETEKSFVFTMLEKQNRYANDQIETAFGGKERLTVSKAGSRHGICVWGDSSFTIYPYRVGVPFYFRREEAAQREGCQCIQNGCCQQ